MEEKRLPTFTRAALQEAASITEQVPTELQGRPTVRGITIDGPSSGDLDDAFWLEREPHGGYRLQVNIADVGSLITPHTTPALDAAALRRSFTRYYAQRNTPMLPRELSEGALSLLQNQPRPTITITIPFDASLSMGEPQIQRTTLCNERRFAYGEVDEEISHPHTALAPLLQDAYRLTWRLLQTRRAKGALALYDLNTGWATTEEGSLIRLPEGQRHKAQIIIQEWMIVTNQSLALYFAERGIPALYRNHAAKAIALDRAALLEMITTAITHPEVSNPERVRTTVNLAMERARYGPQVAGHFGLNLPAYLHMTSPLRRYPDLVNQRILHAVLKKEAPPYTIDELETMAAHINAEEDQMRDAKKVHFLAEYQEPIRRAIVQGEQTQRERPFAQMESGAFHSALKMAAEEQRLSPNVAQELFYRLDEGRLSAHDIYTLVFRFPTSGEEWNRVKQAALDWLERHPHHAASLYLMGQQQYGWEDFHDEITAIGKDHQRVFQARISTIIDGQRYTSSLHQATQKDRAKYAALAEILRHIATGKESASPTIWQEQFPSPEMLPAELQASSTTPPPVASNEKGRLLELAQAHRWSKPVFRERERVGPPHAPTFTIEATLVINGNTYAATGTGTTKAQAEHEAARRVRELLPPLEENRLTAPAAAATRAVSILHEMAQKQEIASVTYEYQQSGPPNEPTFLCTCVVKGLDGRETVTTGTGKTKKVAALHAAQQIIAALFPSDDESD